ncbi:hypothetical protein FJZ27_01125 [Candidatus Peribacteria bacterium]|nr:hypothetical protein [Candidatus Peribacteria bacterium]
MRVYQFRHVGKHHNLITFPLPCRAKGLLLIWSIAGSERLADLAMLLLPDTAHIETAEVDGRD